MLAYYRSKMIERLDVLDAVFLAYPGRKFPGMTDLTGGFDFLVYRVDLEDGESVVFRGQRNEISTYEGAIEYGAQLAGEQRFYERVPHDLCIEPDEAALGFPYGFFTYKPGSRLSELFPQVSHRHA